MSKNDGILKSFKKYDFVIDKGKIFTTVVVLLMMILFFFFMLYLGDVL